jgi:hypothetical protein
MGEIATQEEVRVIFFFFVKSAESRWNTTECQHAGKHRK